jgi:hypothetical protein
MCCTPSSILFLEIFLKYVSFVFAFFVAVTEKGLNFGFLFVSILHPPFPQQKEKRIVICDQQKPQLANTDQTSR